MLLVTVAGTSCLKVGRDILLLELVLLDRKSLLLGSRLLRLLLLLVSWHSWGKLGLMAHIAYLAVLERLCTRLKQVVLWGLEVRLGVVLLLLLLLLLMIVHTAVLLLVHMLLLELVVGLMSMLLDLLLSPLLVLRHGLGESRPTWCHHDPYSAVFGLTLGCLVLMIVLLSTEIGFCRRSSL